jgi:hypothetical protein
MMDMSAFTRFDFSEWSSLAREDPARFEARREEEIERLIAAAPAHIQPRLRRLQWRIDMERRRHSNPLGACLGIYGMMMDSVYGEQGLLPALKQLVHGRENGQVEVRSAAILPFTAV